MRNKFFYCIGVVLFSAAFMSPSKAKAKSLTGHVDSTIEFGVALLFENDYGTSGMSGVSADIQDCYRKMMIG